MTERHRVLPFPVSPQLDTSDLVIGVSLDDLVDGITAAATGLPAPPVRTVVTKIQEKTAQVVALRPKKDDGGTQGKLSRE
jgi:hypothetical protein